MLTRGLLRYLATDAVRGGRWVAPALCYVAGVLVFDAGGGTALSCYQFSAALLLPIGLWLAVAVGNSEDPVQADITVVTVGDPARVRLAKLAVAYLGCLGLAAVGLGWPVFDHPVTGGAVVVGGVQHVVLALAGVAFGAPLSRPVVDRVAWGLVGGVGVTLAELLVPGSLPLRRMLSLLPTDSVHPAAVAVPLALLAAETLTLAAVLVAGAHLVARRRR